ncbi:MAG TPA: methylated-DNA--[protein]-cysteine S-methyltransferase, partial [Desulfomonilaceae bacterium]|nr:methylated-DNA--[protein]-cysteine S-methyltransferase [Desulfomonilaceae bacterium]
EAIGNPKAVRAVGAANGRNPIPIVIPCHRCIGSDGSLTGFGGGLDTKKRLIDLERSYFAGPCSRGPREFPRFAQRRAVKASLRNP